MRHALAVAATAISLALPATVAAQTDGFDPAALRLRVLTMGQGDAIWERFGHNAIWVSTASAPSGVAFNWGLFDFAEPGFLARFLTGDTRYWMDGFDANATIELYQQRDREVWSDELNLSTAQRKQLLDFLQWNQQPANRYYTYDYFLDNCSTRLRDALDRVMNGALREQTHVIRTGTTFRSHTKRLLEENPLAYAGIIIALGQPADREISAWEEMFLPGRLREHIMRARIDTGGAVVPLIRNSTLMASSNRPTERPRAHSYVENFIGIGIFAGVLLLLSGALMLRGKSRYPFVILGSAWYLASGLLGLILSLAWMLTRHQFWFRNENLLLLHPLLLALAVMLPLAMRASAGTRLRLWTRYLAVAVAGIGVLALASKALPMFYQRNFEVLALVLPAHLAIAAVMWRWSDLVSHSPEQLLMHESRPSLIETPLQDPSQPSAS